MFNYHYDHNNLKNLRKKIYNKQKNLLNFIYINNISYKDPQIKKYINEINLLEEIFDIKMIYFNYDKKNFWNNKEKI